MLFPQAWKVCFPFFRKQKIHLKQNEIQQLIMIKTVFLADFSIIIPMQGQPKKSIMALKEQFIRSHPPASSLKKKFVPKPKLPPSSPFQWVFDDFRDPDFRKEMDVLLEEKKEQDRRKELEGGYESLEQERAQIRRLEQACTMLESKDQLSDFQNFQVREMFQAVQQCKTSPHDPSFKFEAQLGNERIEKEEIYRLNRENLDRREQKANQVVRKRRLLIQAQMKKGLIRVYCRIKPKKSQPTCCSSEDKTFVSKIWKKNFQEKLVQVGATYCFDHIFGEAASQQEVFEEFKEAIDISIFGRKVCIFGYGQTASGKSHTMHGSKEKRGLSYRAISHIFAALLQEQNEKGIDFQLAIGASEISVKGKKDLVSHCPMQNQAQAYVIVRTEAQAFTVLQTLIQARLTSSTDQNETSSRSHMILVFKITLFQPNLRTEGLLCLVDLAGSEKSNDHKDKEETSFINKSLADLATVMTQLGENRVLTPNISPLTSSLQRFLGRKTITTMIVNVSPEYANAHETRFSADFASKVKSIKKK